MEHLRRHTVDRDGHLPRRLGSDTGRHRQTGLLVCRRRITSAHSGIAYERLDDAQVGYTHDGTQIDATELPEATRRSLRNRFGANVSSIGVFR